MLIPLLLLVLLALIALPTAVATWALIEANRIGTMDTGDHEDDWQP